MPSALYMKFIADVMLGRLAKFMRICGLDVAYDCTLSDNEIIHISLEQERTILTRDTRLIERPLASNHLLITSDRAAEQFRQVIDSFHIDINRSIWTRCTVCNTPLSRIEKEDARDLVPQYVYIRHSDFMRCDGCKKIYWKGTHVERIRKLIYEAGLG